MRVGAILKACRIRAGLSQEELAHRLFINQSDISKYEHDTKEPTVSVLYEWMTKTESQEVLVAFFCGVDGLNIMQQIIDAGLGVIGSIVLGGVI